MTTEEKAKAYDEAIKKAKKDLQVCEQDCLVAKQIFRYFPELAKPEDEKIRKRIIALVNAHGQGIYKGDMLAWLENIPYTIDHEKREGFHLGYKAGLEKQGEQSSLNINRECLKGIKRVQEYQDLSDWEKEFDNIASMYAHNKNQEGYNDSWYVKERAAEMLYYAKKELEKQGEQKPAWSCEDETRLQACLDTLQANSLMGKVDTVMTNWLKSLKNRIKGE